MERPSFESIKDYQEFSQYYWYRNELKQICKKLGIANNGTKEELYYNIEQYYSGNFIQDTPNKVNNIEKLDITLDSKLLECGFSFNQKFRDYFSKLTGIDNFRFNADMAATWRAVKKNNDKSFTVQDMIDVYLGKKEYVKYNHSYCEWNKFYKDFCTDKRNAIYKNKMKVASILWNKVRNSTKDKVYTEELIKEYESEIKEYE